MKTSDAASPLKTDQANAPSKKDTALLSIGGQKLRELFSILILTADLYKAAKTILKTHFTSKQSLTAERFKFLCTKPIDSNETHDYWIIRLRTKVKDYEINKRGDDDAIKLLITLQTHSEKLQWSIIQKDMDLAKLVSTAWSLELAKKREDFLKNNTLHSNTHTIEADTISDDQKYNNHPQGGKEFKKETKKTIEICRYCGEKAPHAGCRKAWNAICNLCSKKGHFEKVCESINVQVKETNRVSHQNFRKDWNEYPMVTKVPNGKHYGDQEDQLSMTPWKEASIIFASTYLEHLVLKPSETKLKIYSLLLLPLIGQLAVTISTNEKQIKTIIHVSKNHGTQLLISKYTKFDLSILPICQQPASTHQPA